MSQGVVIVGASLAGLATAEGLRSASYDGAIHLIGDEPYLPYDRPPLSKHFLLGEWGEDKVFLRTAEALEKLRLNLHLETTATALDVGARCVTLSSGEQIAGDTVVIATGAAARLPARWHGIENVFVLRSLADAYRLKARLALPGHVLLVGAGFIGAEAAAVARQLGRGVTMVDPLACPMELGLGPQIGAMVGEVHAEHGVDLRCGLMVRELVVRDGLAVGAELSDGSFVDADTVIVGLGAAPNVGWLSESGLQTDDGVLCDEYCRAAPGIYAAGDVAKSFNPLFGEHVRVGHRYTSAEQGAYVGRSLAKPDTAEPFSIVPFFWSDQYDLRIQCHGHILPSDTCAIVEGSLAERRLLALFGRAGRVSGLVAINMARRATAMRSVVAARQSWSDVTTA